jgi:hypothetical protein
MYRTCIFCSADLGTNEAIAPFPVGRSLAFDGARGRLWAVCPKCARWNLAPIEERWEAVEEAERAFRDSRLRVQSRNIGVCKLPDGTRLVRIGQALTGELAAWRYGSQLVRRRRQYLVAGAALGTAGVAAVGGLVALGAASGAWSLWSVASALWEARQTRRVIHRIPAAQSPLGRDVAIRRWHVQAAQVGAADDGIELRVPDAERKDRKTDGWGRARFGGDEVLVLPDAQARTVLGRAMVHVNRKGASHDHVRDAVGLLADARGAEEYLREAGRRESVLGRRQGMEAKQLTPVGALALEMALHEEQERRAMEGELAGLEAAWRDAEEIAAIADALPDGVPAPEPSRLIVPG